MTLRNKIWGGRESKGASEMAQEVKGPAAKLAKLSLIPRTHTLEQNRFL